MSFDPGEYLNAVAVMPDDEIDLAPAAIALAACEHPGLSLDRYFNHLKKLAEGVRDRYVELLEAGADDAAETRLAALKHVLSDRFDYAGDSENYDDLENADLIRVIDRRKGMPIALAILYIHAGQAQDWDIHGLNFPGHFLVRLDKDGQRLIFDPFEGCRVMQAPDLRALLKQAMGPKAELSAHYYEPAGGREILIRLQNNIKLRRIDLEDYEGALKTVEAMRRVDPDEYRLLLDAGVLYARTGRSKAAVAMLEDYIAKAPDPRDRHEAELLLQHIWATVHDKL